MSILKNETEQNQNEKCGWEDKKYKKDRKQIKYREYCLIIHFIFLVPINCKIVCLTHFFPHYSFLALHSFPIFPLPFCMANVCSSFLRSVYTIYVKDNPQRNVAIIG